MEQRVENWKDIKGFEGYYQISTLGRVKSLERYIQCKNCIRYIPEKIRSLGKCWLYPFVSLSKNGKVIVENVHRLVAEAFIPNPDNLPQVNHKDGNKFNNCVENLEWVTCSENVIHAIKTNLIDLKDRTEKSNKAHFRKLTKEQVDFIRKNYTPGLGNLNQSVLGKMFNVDKSTIGKIINNINWKE